MSRQAHAIALRLANLANLANLDKHIAVSFRSHHFAFIEPEDEAAESHIRFAIASLRKRFRPGGEKR